MKNCVCGAVPMAGLDGKDSRLAAVYCYSCGFRGPANENYFEAIREWDKCVDEEKKDRHSLHLLQRNSKCDDFKVALNQAKEALRTLGTSVHAPSTIVAEGARSYAVEPNKKEHTVKEETKINARSLVERLTSDVRMMSSWVAREEPTVQQSDRLNDTVGLLDIYGHVLGAALDAHDKLNGLDFDLTESQIIALGHYADGCCEVGCDPGVAGMRLIVQLRDGGFVIAKKKVKP